MRIDLTDRACSTSKPGDLFDGKQRGLICALPRLAPRTWYCIFTAPDGKRGRVGLGRYPAVTLARARTMAREAQQRLRRGLTPERRIQARRPSGLVEDFIKRHARKLKTGKAFATRLRNNVVPVIGNVRLSELHRRDVHRVLDVIKDRGSPLAASKAQQDVRTMVRWAIQRGDLDADPMLGMQAALKSKPRERFLSEEEIAKRLAGALDPGEARRARSEIGARDGAAHWRNLRHDRGRDRPREGHLDHPGSKTKNGRQHTVPSDRDGARIIAEARRRRYQWPAVSDLRLGQARSRLARCAASSTDQRLGSARSAQTSAPISP